MPPPESCQNRYFIWAPDQHGTQVLLNLDLIDSLAEWAGDAAREGREVQGVLLGHGDLDCGSRPVVVIEDCEPAGGPREPERIRAHKFRPVGILRSGLGPTFAPSESDDAVLADFFPDPNAVLLLVRPGHPALARIFLAGSSEETPPFPFDSRELESDPVNVFRMPARSELTAAQSRRTRQVRDGVLMACATLLVAVALGWVHEQADHSPPPAVSPLAAAPPPPEPAAVANTVDAAPPEQPTEAPLPPKHRRKVRFVKDEDSEDWVNRAARSIRRGEPLATKAVAGVRVPDPGPTVHPSEPVPSSPEPSKPPAVSAAVSYIPAPDSTVKKVFRKVPGLLMPWRERAADFKPAKPVREVRPAVTSSISVPSRVELEVFLDEKGKVSGIEAESGLDHRLVAAATTAVYASVFEPARRNGKPVPSRLIGTFNFRKDD